MEKDKKLVLLCTKIICVVGVLFTLMELLTGKFVSAGLIVLMVAIMVVPIFLGYRKWSVETSSTFLCIGAFFVVLFIECIKGEVDMMFPLYIACFSVGAMFFRLSLLKIQAIFINLGLLAVILLFGESVCVGLDFSYLLRAFLGMNACFFLIYTAIKWGCGFMESAKSSQHENSSLLGQVQDKLEENQNTANQQRQLLSQVHMAAQDIFSGSERVSASAQSISSSSVEQADSIHSLMTQLDDISAQVEKTSANAQEACSQVGTAGVSVESCNEKMREMTQAMSVITRKSNEISKIIKTIEDIAFQTNILALNAAVEAARAGTAGKGFAVVADEVRNLANKSSDASKNTAALIEDSIAAIDKGMSIAKVAAGALSQVTDTQQRVAATVDLISGSAQKQMQSITHVAGGISQISQVVQQNSNTAQESSQASEQLFHQARILQDLVSKFEQQSANQTH